MQREEFDYTDSERLEVTHWKFNITNSHIFKYQSPGLKIKVWTVWYTFSTLLGTSDEEITIIIQEQRNSKHLYDDVIRELQKSDHDQIFGLRVNMVSDSSCFQSCFNFSTWIMIFILQCTTVLYIHISYIFFKTLTSFFHDEASVERGAYFTFLPFLSKDHINKSVNNKKYLFKIGQD